MYFGLNYLLLSMQCGNFMLLFMILFTKILQGMYFDYNNIFLKNPKNSPKTPQNSCTLL